ncbi:hypothetical protein GTW54_02820 [Streptomyces sp. SID5468]|nr:hypothetical protein [Streptomyces sp. SID5468]
MAPRTQDCPSGSRGVQHQYGRTPSTVRGLVRSPCPSQPSGSTGAHEPRRRARPHRRNPSAHQGQPVTTTTLALPTTGEPRRGYFAIGIYATKTSRNVGMLWRAAALYGAAFVFTVGARYRHQATDTCKTPLHTPLLHFCDLEDLVEHLPHACQLVGVEMSENAVPLTRFVHPARAAYLLGAEDTGLPAPVLDRCHTLLTVPTMLPISLNVAVAGSITLYDRHAKAVAR